jgi:hypothetical protein
VKPGGPGDCRAGWRSCLGCAAWRVPGKRRWVALSEGSAPTGFTAQVRVSSGATFRRPVINGGFDPAPLAALVGDTVAVTVRDPQGRVVATLEASVKTKRPPVIVRTEPPPRKRDVPLNMSLLVVFSEPVDPATVNGHTVRLLNRNGLPLAGQVYLDPDGLRAVFRPTGYLNPNSSYTLDINSGVTGLSGEPLATPQQVEFTTGNQPAGFLRVITTTTGLSPDPDGYRVVVDGDFSRAVQVSAPDTVSVSIGEGTHIITFAGGAPDCVVMQPTWSGTVQAAQTTTVRVPIDCGDGSRTGVAFEVSTTGVDVDDSYVLEFCAPAGCSWFNRSPVPANVMRVIEIPAGQYAVALQGVAPNCSGDTRAALEVVQGQLTTLRMEVVCSPATALRISALTSGSYIPASFLVRVDGLSYLTLPAGGSAITDLKPGSHHVELELPSECSVTGASEVDVEVLDGETTDVAFSVTCQTPGTLIVWSQVYGPSPDDSFTVTLDGRYRGVLDANSTLPLAVADGTHAIGLGDIAPNCTLSGPNPATATVRWGETATLILQVTCVSSP